MSLLKNISICILVFTIASCAPKKYAVSEKSYKKQLKAYLNQLKQTGNSTLTDSTGAILPVNWVATTNFSIRKPNFVIIHHTAQDSTNQTLKTFTIPKTQVSAHYVIGRDGQVYHMLNDYLRAWHAGVSKWGNDTDINSSSIGIELDNNGLTPFAEPQIKSLLTLLAFLKKQYSIPTANFIGHADIAPKRKPDPNEFFPWKKLAEKGFGYWYDTPQTPPDSSFNTTEALRRIGYDTRDLNAATVAFKRHFVQTDLTPVLTAWDKCVLWNLYRKY